MPRPSKKGSLWARGVALVLCISGAWASSPAAIRQTDATVLKAGAAIERTLAGGETNLFRVALGAGQYVRVVVEQRGIDVTVTLIAPNGERIVEVNNPNGNRGPESVSAIVGQTGEYSVEVRGSNKNAPAGTYEIRLDSLREPTEADRKRAEAEQDFREAVRFYRQATAESRRVALEKFEALLPVFRDLDDRAMEVLTLNTIGLSHHVSGELPKALDYYSQALTVSRLLGEPNTQAMLLNNIGGVYDILGEPQKALDYYGQALPLWYSLNNNNGRGDTLNNIGVIYFNLGELQTALDYYQQAFALRKESGDDRREADSLDNLSTVYRLLGEPQQALDQLERALELRRIAKDVRGEGNSLHNIGYTYVAMDDKAKALDCYDRALPLRRATGDRRGEAITLNAAGEVYALLGEKNKALERHQQALQLLRAIGDRRLEAVTLVHLGNLAASSGELEQASENHRQAIAIFESLSARRDEAWARQQFARVERDRGNLVEARRQIAAALGLVEALRAQVSSRQLRISYIATQQSVYEFYIDLLMRMHRREPAAGYDALAFQVSERARARGLLEMLAESGIDIRQGVDPTLLEREQTLSQLLNAKGERMMRLLGQRDSVEASALKQEMSRLETDYQQVQGDIRRRSPHYAALTQPQPLGLPEVQQQVLDDDTMLLEYSLGTERSYLWAVTQNSYRSYELPARAQIEQSARRVYELARTRGRLRKDESEQERSERIRRADYELAQATTQLSELLLGPVAAELSNKRLAIVADGMLQYIPFAMLLIPGGVLRPLIVDHELVSLPSASTLAVQRKESAGRRVASKNIAVIADPVFEAADRRVAAHSPTPPGPTLTARYDNTRMLKHLGEEDGSGSLRVPRLPYTRQEAERILSLVPAGSSLKATDFNARRTSVLDGELRDYRYLHFATHGYIDSERPWLSAMVLSLVDERGQPQDGYLRAQEIYNLQLPAELVVLSACRTGLGREVKGEGFLGLTRGFMYAGTPRVIVSLWSVSDRATADLMGRLYAGMVKSGQRPAAALRSAQLEMWRQKGWSQPYYWAAFVQQGDWR